MIYVCVQIVLLWLHRLIKLEHMVYDIVQKGK
jgi:hypothetical protein